MTTTPTPEQMTLDETAEAIAICCQIKTPQDALRLSDKQIALVCRHASFIAAQLAEARELNTAFEVQAAADLESLKQAEAAAASARDKALDEAKRVVKRHRGGFGGCEALGPMDPETGTRECSLENNHGTCPCAEQIEAAEKILAAIDAIKSSPQPTAEPEVK